MGKTARTGQGDVGPQHRWTEAQAREALGELASSGETAVGFARRKGVSTQRLLYWRKRLAARTTAGPEFVAVALRATASRGAVEVVAGHAVVRVQEGVDVEYVARLVEAVVRRGGGAC